MAEIERELRASGASYNSYLATDPTHGSGNQEVTWITTSENEGRADRGPIAAVYESDNDPSLQVRLDVTQKGKPVFINVVDPRACNGQVIGPGNNVTKSFTVSNEGSEITLTVASNAKKLYYFIGNETVSGYDQMQFAPLSNTYDVEGTLNVNNTDITGDPGKGRAFDCKIAFEVLSNATINSRAGTLYIRAYNDEGAYCTYILKLKQEKAEEYLWIAKPESTSAGMVLNYMAGSSESIDILSNGNWHLVI